MDKTETILSNRRKFSKRGSMNKNAVYHDGGGQALQSWREKRRLGRSDAAKMFNVTVDCIYKIETGQRRPGRKLLSNMRALQYHRLAADILRK